MSTALAFKMAAEILKTVLVHDLSELLILGAIVLLRGAMSLLLHFELKHSKQDRAAAQEMETGSTEDIGSSALPTKAGSSKHQIPCQWETFALLPAGNFFRFWCKTRLK